MADIGSMMSVMASSDAARRMATGHTSPHGRGMSTSATSIVRQAPTGTAAAAAASTQTGSTDNDADISSNDFLTLLVTEMQNQDPTQPTDPNAYIQQLVEVNSLQQLISINQDLSPSTGTPGTSPASEIAGLNAPTLASTSSFQSMSASVAGRKNESLFATHGITQAQGS